MIQYTTINHQARLALGLNLNEYAVADSIYKLSTSPKSVSKGWCGAKKETLSSFLEVDRRSITRYLTKLENLGLVEKNPKKPRLIRTTVKWFETVVEWDKMSQNNAVKMGQNVPKNGTKCPKEWDKMSLSTYNSIDNKSIINPQEKFKEIEEGLIKDLSSEQMFLEYLAMNRRLEMPWILGQLPIWAKENIPTTFKDSNHKKNSFKRWIVQAASGSSKNQSPTFRILKGGESKKHESAYESTGIRLSEPMLKPDEVRTNGVVRKLG